MYFDPGYGYHTDQTVGIARGNDPESMCVKKKKKRKKKKTIRTW